MAVPERRAREFQRRERELLDAALALFRRSDWQAVTIEQIAARAEIGKGTVYKHFASKDELVARLALDVQLDLLRCLRRLAPCERASDALRQLVEAFFDVHALLAPEYRRVLQHCERLELFESLPARTRQAHAELNADISAISHEVLERGMAAGEFERKPMAQTLFLLQAAVFGAIHMAWTGCIPGRQEARYRTELCDFVLAGLRKARK